MKTPDPEARWREPVQRLSGNGELATVLCFVSRIGVSSASFAITGSKGRQRGKHISKASRYAKLSSG